MKYTYLLWPWLAPAFQPYRLPAPDSGACSRAQQERRLRGPSGPLGADTRIKARTVPALWLTPREQRARSRRQKETITAQAAWERTDAKAGAPAGPQGAHAQKASARGLTPRRLPYLHGHAEVHHGDAGVAVPAHVHHGVAAVRGLALQRGARGAEVVLRLLVARCLLRGLCGGSKEAALSSLLARRAPVPTPPRSPMGWEGWGSRAPTGQEVTLAARVWPGTSHHILCQGAPNSFLPAPRPPEADKRQCWPRKDAIFRSLILF